MGRESKKRGRSGRQLKPAALPLEIALTESRQAETDQRSVLVFYTAGEIYAIDVDQTEGVVDCPRVSPLPRAPDGMIGVASVRGRITIVMQLGPMGVLPEDRKRLILLKGESQLGFLADRVEGVLVLAPRKIRRFKESQKISPELQGRRDGVRWPVSSYFVRDKTRIPIIDVQRLADM